MKVILSFALLVLTASAPTQSQPKSGQPAASPGLEPARAARIDQLLQRYVDENRIAGAVALVLRDGKRVYGLGFGLGFQTVDRYGASGMAGVGAFGWGGDYGTTYQVDVQSHSVLVLMIQLMPNATDIQPKFNTLVYQALVN